MNVQATNISGQSQASPVAAFFDRWIYVLLASLFLVTVLSGFVPTSIMKLEQVSDGMRPPLPGFLHFHAIMMGTWIMLLLAQSTLMALGIRSLHMKLGLVSVAVLPAVLISMIGVAGAVVAQLAVDPPAFIPAEQLAEARPSFVSFQVLIQIRLAFPFAILAIWALLVRREDPETHKRLMFIATVFPLSAAIDRVVDPVVTFIQTPLQWDVTQLLWLSPLLIYDLARRGSLHKAYAVGIAVVLPFTAFTHIAYEADWWLAFAPRIYGIQNW
jgi:hypothetical protein